MQIITKYSAVIVLWDTLLEALSIRALANCIIVKDSVNYYKVLPETTTKQCTRSATGISAMTKFKFKIPTNAKNRIVRYTLKSRQSQCSSGDSRQSKRERSCNGNVKGKIRRQYSTETTFVDITCMLQRGFEKVSPVSEQGGIDTIPRTGN
ncbi:hypothetical protein GN958_ATG18683 [Phytophthora infestans]|uniref:Secreted protein n=1 Tax=Phytophthora infestans TaxID=4787 RepID=A0A8S9TTG7_PHYIN|nr:hypothetical protein GN958_ATG18683 [Phytophthora infestans]